MDAWCTVRLAALDILAAAALTLLHAARQGGTRDVATVGRLAVYSHDGQLDALLTSQTKSIMAHSELAGARAFAATPL
jgi:hypothetical protein